MLAQGYGVHLDGRPLRTPAGAVLVLPTRDLAQSVAEEWQVQDDVIDVDTMPLTRLLATATDRVPERRGAVVEQVVRYGSFDLLCYRVAEPVDLSLRQRERWQPLVDWASDRWGVQFNVTYGVMPTEQPPAALEALRLAVEDLNELELTALACLTQASGSVILAFAVEAGRIDTEALFEAAQLDEIYQAQRWGEIDEAVDRRQRLKGDIAAAAQVLAASAEARRRNSA